MDSIYKIIPFNIKHGNCGGSLVQFQQGVEPENALPFSIGKVLVSSDMNPDDVRGNHAHYETEEIVVALSGGCTFELDDGCGRKETVSLSSSEVSEQRTEVSDGGSGNSNPISDLRPPISASPESNFLYPSQDETGALDIGNSPNSKPQTSDIKPALLLYPHIWRTFYDFEPGTVLLVVANITYDEADYIRDRAEFERIAETWSGLGGSAV
ncbi:sugar 3,4-ketoisomerase [Pontiella sulfatireligans]|uniref:TDP-4-oxo-6-deoxy-alpha-D-glucose-3,4-oxoisomeras e n=1 Tax=Pontiella sulfatireligans TaxID=2750658 RepID=A0A6C2UDK7_9BACT|nr:FdtA/QdtA family cupin domain-containing protein [Pontiella sulfatireligans]VGO18278.1 TDP-4-oxo-6-deoxy-alpha-D-glucose-3,4-oxoisomerase [Pontiella sulfatireligans]